MDERSNLGKKAMDTATGIHGTITGVWYSMHESERYLIEYVDKNGTGCQHWSAAGRVRIAEEGQ